MSQFVVPRGWSSVLHTRSEARQRRGSRCGSERCSSHPRHDRRWCHVERRAALRRLPGAGRRRQGEEAEEERERERPEPVVGGANAESAEIFNALTSVSNARLAPRRLRARRSAHAGDWASSSGLTSNGGTWDEVTDLPYDADDPNYRDPSFSNSSGGAGFVAGRITGLAVGNGFLFAGGANGGVFRKSLGANLSQHQATTAPGMPISDSILSLSTGDLVYDADERHALVRDRRGQHRRHVVRRCRRLPPRRTPPRRTVHRRRPGRRHASSRAAASTSSRSTPMTARLRRDHPRAVAALRSTRRWPRVVERRPDAEPGRRRRHHDAVQQHRQRRGHPAGHRQGAGQRGVAQRRGATTASTTATTARPARFQQDQPEGRGSTSNDVGNAEFAYSADGSKSSTPSSSRRTSSTTRRRPSSTASTSRPSGTLARPVEPDRRLAASSPAPAPRCRGRQGVNYRPGVQAWYNNFIEVDPTDADHVYLGLEEVYETTDGGATGARRARTGTSASRAGTISDPRRTAARRPRTPTSTRSRSTTATSTSATTAA